MSKICRFNKDRLLELYFREAGSRDEAQIRHHLEQCLECRTYLRDLERADRFLGQWPDAAPAAGTLELIMEKIRTAEPKAIPAKPAAPMWPMAPFFKILGFIVALVVAITRLRHLIPRFSFWGNVQKWWIVQILGPLGVAAVLVFFFGAFGVLSLSPGLIWEAQTRK